MTKITIEVNTDKYYYNMEDKAYQNSVQYDIDSALTIFNDLKNAYKGQIKLIIKA